MHEICLDVVPDETSPWYPEIAPQAMVMKRKGRMGGAASGLRLIAGAWMTGLSTSKPARRRPRPVISWWALR